MGQEGFCAFPGSVWLYPAEIASFSRGRSGHQRLLQLVQKEGAPGRGASKGWELCIDAGCAYQPSKCSVTQLQNIYDDSLCSL